MAESQDGPPVAQADAPGVDGGVAGVFASDGALSRLIPGFSARDAQRDMAVQVAATLEQGGVLAAEAGTGTGKTLAYLVPLLQAGRPGMVSTGTRHLQEQLFHKDLPVALRATGARADCALLKGRANYLCLYRLRQNLESAEVVDRRVAADLVVIREWARRTRSGDTAELSQVGEHSGAWRLATSTRDNCLGASCEHYDDCHLFKARRRASEADLLVVNHHLLLSQFVLDEQGHGELLPTAHSLVVDEAHQLPELASEFFGTALSSAQLLELCRDVDLARRTEARDLGELSRLCGALEQAVRTLRLGMGAGIRRLAFAEFADDAKVRAGIEALRDTLQALAQGLELGRERGSALESCAQRAAATQVKLERLQVAEQGDHLSWIDVRLRGFNWRLSPLDVSDVLGPRLREDYRSVLLTSATLAVAGTLDHFLLRAGLEQAQQAIFPSPFDYARQSLLYLPRDLPEPRHPDFTVALHRRIESVLAASHGRAFVLFTSHGALNRARETLAPRLPFPVLSQGDAPRGELLQRFRALGNAVLLGTYSFWEGVDVRGEALSCVIIDKLPFAPPGDPLLRAQLQRLRDLGGDPFMDYQVPQAALLLKQGVGRLIRDQHDRGVVVVCDCRMSARGYGSRLLASLPPMPVTHDLVMVEAFFADVQ
jgi:ATP-dependent DNA helicase DinG